MDISPNYIKMLMTNVHLLVFCIIGMANTAVHFDMETTNYMKVGKHQPNLGRKMDTPGMCNYPKTQGSQCPNGPAKQI